MTWVSISGYLPGYRKAEKPGLNAVEMIDAVKSGKLAALYIMGDDPVGSDPDLKPVLEKLEFLVVQDIFMTETAKLAQVVLPAASSAEKTGTFTNLERRLQQLNKAEEPVGESRPDWEIIQDVAKRMGGSMNYGSPREILKEIRSVGPDVRRTRCGRLLGSARSRRLPARPWTFRLHRTRS